MQSTHFCTFSTVNYVTARLFFSNIQTKQKTPPHPPPRAPSSPSAASELGHKPGGQNQILFPSHPRSGIQKGLRCPVRVEAPLPGFFPASHQPHRPPPQHAETCCLTSCVYTVSAALAHRFQARSGATAQTAVSLPSLLPRVLQACPPPPGEEETAPRAQQQVGAEPAVSPAGWPRGPPSTTALRQLTPPPSPHGRIGELPRGCH